MTEKRFKNWQKPKFNSKDMTKWNWMCQHHDKLELNEFVDIGAFTYINAKYGVKIEKNVQIGSHCSIYSLSTIDDKKGKNALVGAYSFVNKNIPDDSVAFGIPIQIKKSEEDQ